MTPRSPNGGSSPTFRARRLLKPRSTSTVPSNLCCGSFAWLSILLGSYTPTCQFLKKLPPDIPDSTIPSRAESITKAFRSRVCQNPLCYTCTFQPQRMCTKNGVCPQLSRLKRYVRLNRHALKTKTNQTKQPYLLPRNAHMTSSSLRGSEDTVDRLTAKSVG